MAGVQPCLDAADGVTNFLAAGEAPIYIGFGGMTGFDNTRLLDALIEAMAARRALFHPGWSGVDPKTLPDNFFAIGDTLAVPSAARAGAPSIVTPFADGWQMGQIDPFSLRMKGHMHFIPATVSAAGAAAR